MTLNNLYRQLSKLPVDEQITYLIGKGYSEADARDFVNDTELRKAKFIDRKNEPKFSQSPKFKEIQERARKLQEKRNGEGRKT
jgi:hypothetical protein